MEKDFNIFLKKAETEVEEMPTFKEYAIDFKTGEYIKDENNDIKVLEKNEALKVWIFKALKTERFRYTDVHSDNYGSELETNIGTIYQKSVKDALMINQIRDTLLVNPYILECYNFDISNENEYVPQITFNVRTIYGELEMEV
ncbi:Phage-like element PBSX protein xkdS [Fusobacterium vincentii ATCC 49256]|uniref:Phage-like element PBSX protein xkdS n=1 Tax=Fusobacterium vincentii ATCC 49256 TaxID=209882 RepID=Q7P496_FUSVC|nr:Phage-like element PBSX protein xkdS [Fusobacterium vincentii ATCC 49256]